MTKQVIISIDDLANLLHKWRGIARDYYLIDEEDTNVEIAFREADNEGKIPDRLFPIISWSNERAVIPVEIIEYDIKKLIEGQKY